jgi:predicted MFS family arabinose efflux permease
MLIPILPELVEAASLHHGPDTKDLCAGVFNAFLGIGQLCAPAFGTLMFSHCGFRTTSTTVAGICIGFASVYIVKGDGLQAFKKSFNSQDHDLE